MHHVIYLNKGGHPQETKFWKYYRISSEGNEGDHVEVCLVEWPTFKDIDKPGEIDKAAVVNPGDTGFASAYPNLLALLKNKWKIDHKDEDVIGFIVPRHDDMGGELPKSSRHGKRGHKVGKAPKAQYRVKKK